MQQVDENLSGAKNMTDIVSNGNKVKVHYEGTLDDGSVFDTSKEREPIDFEVGTGQLIAGFEKALVGMKKGEKKKIVIDPQDAYGEHVKELIKVIERKYLPQQITPQVGQQLQLGEGERKWPLSQS